MECFNCESPNVHCLILDVPFCCIECWYQSRKETVKCVHDHIKLELDTYKKVDNPIYKPLITVNKRIIISKRLCLSFMEKNDLIEFDKMFEIVKQDIVESLQLASDIQSEGNYLMTCDIAKKDFVRFENIRELVNPYIRLF